MKQFDPIPNNPEKITIVNQRQVEYEKKYIGSTRRYNGHTIFEINCGTGDIKKAEFSEEKIIIVPHKSLITADIIGNDTKSVREIIIKENCLYICALNIKSVKRKYIDWLIKNGIEKHKK